MVQPTHTLLPSRHNQLGTIPQPPPHTRHDPRSQQLYINWWHLRRCHQTPSQCDAVTSWVTSGPQSHKQVHPAQPRQLLGLLGK